MPIIALGAALLLAGGAGSACAQAAAPRTAPAANDYSDPKTWLCLPGQADPCSTQDLTTTVIAADGTTTVEPFVRASDPAVDCFYVYPTISTDPTPNSDMTPDDEPRVAAVHFARFASVCRTFAPLYRQVTLAALAKAMTGQDAGADRELPYTDVKAAFDWYLAHENKGRGIVLIGHSQGAGIVQRLVKDAFDGKPLRKQLVGAMPIGWSVPVDDKGMFGSIPSCSKLGQTGCLVSYVSFRDTLSPAPLTLFGRVTGAGLHAACVNPGALSGGKAAAHSYLRTRSGAGKQPWVAGKTIETGYVSVPGLLTTECVRAGAFSYLKVTTNADPADPRTDSIGGDLNNNDPMWGLHTLDMNLAMGDLIAVVRAQADSWKKAN
ncbi:MAG: DUF3089 domain-containing protein [Caulobacteraceae bacterium]|nr:MAG: DUF3089 domain-containing protein [Caulobacteraceae bacterium]